MTDRDEPGFDPSDWLAKQFEEGEEERAAPAKDAAPEPPTATPAPQSETPPAAPPPAQPTAVPPPAEPPVTPNPPATAVPGGAFSWGLTPGGDATPVPGGPVTEPGPPEWPAVPATPAEPTPPMWPAEPTPLIPPAEPTPLVPPAGTPTAAFPGQSLEPAPWEPWQTRPVDDALEGATEVIEAEIVGMEPPEGESNPKPGIDDLFGDTSFRDYAGDQVFSGPPPATPRGPRSREKGSRAPLPRAQKVLLWIAGSLVAALALVALFLVGTRLPAALGPAPALSPSPTPTPTPSVVVLPAGPLAPGEYQWDELLGGECLLPFESAWQDRYVVVDCATPHPAQMVVRGRFEDAVGTPFPGPEELQKRINLLCTSANVINYQLAATAQDIQVTASYPVDEADWAAGNRTYFCFVSRSSGENLTASIAVPQPAVTLTPLPSDED